MTGANVVAVHRKIHLTNREGRDGENSGVTVVSIARGKGYHVKDYIIDLGDNVRRNWSAALPRRRRTISAVSGVHLVSVGTRRARAKEDLSCRPSGL